MRTSGYVWVFVALAALKPDTADAGRYCGSAETLAPGDGSTLPIGPTIAMHVEDAYFEGRRQARAVPTKLKITLEGKPVKFTTKDVRVADGVIRYITIQNRGTGTLVVRAAKAIDGEIEEFGTYTIVESWTAPEAPKAVVSRGVDERLSVYHLKGHFVRVGVDVPAISYAVKWRDNAKAKWRSLTLPASLMPDYWSHSDGKADPTVGKSEARVGEGICGMVDIVSIASLQAGIELELTAKLPNGKTVKVTDGLTNPFVLPKKPATGRPSYEDDPLGLDPE